MAHEVSNAEQQKEFGSYRNQIARANPEVTPQSVRANVAQTVEDIAHPKSDVEQVAADAEKMKIGGKTTKRKTLVHKGEKVDAGIPEVERHQRTPNQADKINPPVRLKWDGSGEDTFTKVKKTGSKKLPLGSTVQPAPATSSSISPDGIVKRDKNKRFQF